LIFARWPQPRKLLMPFLREGIYWRTRHDSNV
jgi:hypothetical protein